MKKMKKLLAYLLCFSMLAGIMPVPAQAAETDVSTVADSGSKVVDAAIIFSDLHTDKSNYKNGTNDIIQKTFRQLKTVASDLGVKYSSITSGGDAFSVNEENASSSSNRPYTGLTATINTAIRTALGDTIDSSTPINYVWSDHDRCAVLEDGETLLNKKSHISYGAGADGILGTADDGNYYVYSLSMGDLGSYDRYVSGYNSDDRAEAGFTATVEEAVENFEADAAKLIEGRPLFIVSHQPLFNRRNDNAFAELWFDAINEVAATKDVAFFWGHNHNYDQTGDYYYAKGSQMAVATKDNWKSYETGQGNGGKPSVTLSARTKTLNFTHMCMGYLSPATGSNNSNTRKGTAIAVTIYEDSIQYTAYDSNGVYSNSSKSALVLNKTVARDHVVEEVPVDKTSLDAAILAAEALDSEAYVDFSAAAEALAKAKAVAADENATQDAVNAAVEALNAAVEALEEKVEEPETLEGYELNRIEVVNTGVTKYFLGDSVNFEGLKVEAVYTKENEADKKVTILPASEENPDGYVISGYDMNQAGTQYVIVTYEDFVGSFAIEIYQKTVANAAGDVSIAFSDSFVTSVETTIRTKEVSGYSAYVTYNITPVGYTQGDEATVTVAVDTNLFDETRPVKVLDQGTCIAITDIVDGMVTFTTNHFSEYDVVQTDATSTEWTHISTTEGSTYYELTNQIVSGETYVIASGSSRRPYLLTSSGGEGTQIGSNISNNRITSTVADNCLWKFTAVDGGYNIQNSSKGYLYVDAVYEESWIGFLGGSWECSLVTNGNVNSSEAVMTVTSMLNNAVRIHRHVEDTEKNEETDVYVRCSSNKFSATDSANNLYLFKKVVESSSSVYAAMQGATAYRFLINRYTSADAVEQMIRDNIKVYTATDANGSNAHEITSYEIEGSVNPAAEGTTTLNVIYEGKTIGTITVAVFDIEVKDIVVEPKEFTVERDSKVIGTMTVIYDDGSTEVVEITPEMVAGDFNIRKNGTYDNLTINYGTTASEAGVTIHVVNKTGVDDFPTYPNPGSIDLKKSAKGIDFQNTGVARVELSASGLPKARGVDIIVMLDMSSSMNRHTDCGETSCSKSDCEKISRLSELKTALLTLETTLKESKASENMRIAIADFNGFFGDKANTSNTPYDRRDGDRMSDGSTLSTNGSSYRTGLVYDPETGETGAIGADAFKPVSDMDMTKVNAALTTNKATRGTNYDHAFDVIYQLGYAIQKESTEERELCVIFMSDGAPNQFNYFHAIGGSSLTDTSSSENWNYWLKGTMEENGGTSLLHNDATTRTNYGYYYDTTDHDNDGVLNEHRMANAIKGSANDTFTVIRKSKAGLTELLENQSGTNNLYKLPGLGATMYSIGFYLKNDGRITVDSVQHVLHQIASSSEKYVEASAKGELEAAFKNIAGSIAYAATNARYVDQMGSNFNLQMNPTIKTNAKDNENGATTTQTDITITTHSVYTPSQLGKTVNNHVVTNEDVGKAYGNGTNLETVKFAVSGNTITATTNTGGYQIVAGKTPISVTANQTNILVGGVIYGKYFVYNTTTTEKKVTLSNGTSISLPAETFYWNIGTINEVRYTLAYTVYLDGSMEGKVPAGSYDTNNFAVLYYTNHVENEVNKNVASPSLPWEGAQVSYAFYLVDTNGNPLYADGTKAPNFLQAHRVTRPVVYKSVSLNEEGGTTLEAKAFDVLPQGYKLFDENAKYNVVIGSGDGSGDTVSSWTITNGEGITVDTTYVMGYDGANDYSKEKKVFDTSYDYTRTTVYFAVVWTVGTVQDTVVIDYGLDVDINVMTNDMFGTKGTLSAVGNVAKPEGHTAALASGFGTSVSGDFGTATVRDGKVRYSLDKTDGMQINDAETLVYAVDYKGSEVSENNGFYYGDLTIIPATTVYYEDEYVTLTTYTREETDKDNGKVTYSEYETATGWPTDSKAATDLQGEDRPGQFNLGIIDANNLYGYDEAYADMSTFSMDNAAMIHVDAKQYGTAEFEFYGTGFDVISTTSNTTGTLVVQVYECDANGNPTSTLASITDSTTGKVTRLSKSVDTYYGYVYGLYNVSYQKGENGIWTKVSVGDPANEAEWKDKLQTKADLPADAKAGDTATIVHYTWKAVINNPSALYQVPVMKIEGLTYGKYKVKISALYYSTYDHTEAPGYDLHLDAIRIYNPAGRTSAQLSDTIEKAYAADGELFPSYQELRNLILEAERINGLGAAGTIDGIAFIDGNTALNDMNAINGKAVADYESYGPNNEVYLAKGQSLAFDFVAAPLDGYVPVVQIAMKTVGGQTAMAELWHATGTEERFNTISKKIETATDMYYDISVLNGGTIVITNNGEKDSILSITNIKTSYKLAEASAVGIEANVDEIDVEPMKFSVSRDSVNAALISLTSPEKTPAVPEEQPKKPVTEVFPDVEENQWYVECVQYVYDNGIMSGSNGLFKPMADITRAQVVATLYKLEGQPAVDNYAAVNVLKDVQAGQWYTDAICWAYNTGIASGSNGKFNVDNPITRQQLAVMLFSYAKTKGYDTETRADYSELKDADKVASYAVDAMQWAYATELIGGGNDLNPTGNATRAQMAAILTSFVKSMVYEAE